MEKQHFTLHISLCHEMLLPKCCSASFIYRTFQQAKYDSTHRKSTCPAGHSRSKQMTTPCSKTPSATALPPHPSSSSFLSRQQTVCISAGEKNTSSSKLQNDLYLVPADSFTGVQRWETLQNSSTVFQNKHLRVSPPQSIKIGLKQKWYDTFYFLHVFKSSLISKGIMSFKNLLLLITWSATILIVLQLQCDTTGTS